MRKFLIALVFTAMTLGTGVFAQTAVLTDCQPFQLVLDTARCSHLPVPNPADGSAYIDLCPGTEVHLAVKGIYSGGLYTQSDATTTFTWHWGLDDTQIGIGLDSVSHTFTPGHGCEVVVTAADTLGCPAQQSVSFRIRTSANPITGTFNMPELCAGQTLVPNAGTDTSSHIVLKNVGFVQPASLSVGDTVFLPDGENCPPYGLYYRSEVTFTDFPSGAVLTSDNDILYVRIKMEHSAIEDLQIHLVCPNGSSSTILPYPNYNIAVDGGYDYGMMRINLGSAYRPDGGTCSPALNPMGEPWNYIWSDNSTLGYSYASGNGVIYDTSNFHSHYNPHWDSSNYWYFGDTEHSYSVDSTNVAQMTQVYHPYQSFNSLVGCPLNGVWYIQVQDMLPYDNGYIVEWELALSSELMPTGWGYHVGLDTFYLSGNGVENGQSITPETPGLQPVSFTVIDSFECQYDTSFNITVHAVPTVSLGADQIVCPGMNVYLHPTPANIGYQYTWNTGSTASGFYTSEPGTYSVTVSIVGDGVTCSGSDTVELQNYVLPDTTFLRDTICQGYDYENYGFTMSAEFLAHQFSQPAYASWPQSWVTGIQTNDDQHGCDSMVILYLVVYRHWYKEETVFACEQYIWEGDTLTESGDYVKDLTSSHGCDSTVTLHLSIGHPEAEEVWATSCGDYVWNGETFTESGDYIRYFTSSHECDSMVTLHLTVLDTFLRTSNSNPDFCTTRETELSVEGTFDDYLWSTGEVGPSILVTESGLYTLTASNAACQQVERFDIPYCPLNILLPNAITPSKSDGLNDALSISEYEKSQIGEFSIMIYNRWGELVFWSDDKNFRWDGRRDGKLAVGAVYNYLIRCTDRDGKAYVYRGSVTVL